jgi:putative NADPH-quinone reductase
MSLPELRPSFARGWYSTIAGRAPSRAADPCRRILVVNGHPDPGPARFCAALCAAYVAGAELRGWQTRALSTGGLVPDGPAASAKLGPQSDAARALQSIGWADSFVVVFPLWLDRPPAALTRLFEMAKAESAPSSIRRDRPARLIVTMEMPAFAHRSLCRRDASDLERALSLAGTAAREPTFIGSVGSLGAEQRGEWLREMRASGAQGL